MSTGDDAFETIRGLWPASSGGPFAALLPRDAASLADFYPGLKRFVAETPRSHLGSVDPAALVRGEIVSMGEGSVIEAGAVIHESCRLVLGPGSRIRAGAVLRDEVVVGADCLIGVHCEVFRSVLIGPRTMLGHFVLLADIHARIRSRLDAAERDLAEKVSRHSGVLEHEARRRREPPDETA